MTNNFDNSINENIAVYHHFLDGLINSTVGNLVDKVIKTLYNFNITNSKSCEKISFLHPEINGSFNYFLKFNNVNNQHIINFELDFRIEQKYNKTLLDHFLEYFCIFPTSFNNHASSSIIFTKNNKLYLPFLLFNIHSHVYENYVDIFIYGFGYIHFKQ